MTEDTVTITIRHEDAEFMAEDEWVDERLRRIGDACREAVEIDRDVDPDGLC